MGRKSSFFYTPGQYYYARRKAQFAIGQIMILIIVIAIIIAILQEYIIPISIVGGIILVIIGMYYYNEKEQKKEIQNNLVKEFDGKLETTNQYIETIKNNKSIAVIEYLPKNEAVFLKQKCSIVGATKILDNGDMYITNKRIFIVGNKTKSIPIEKLFKIESRQMVLGSETDKIIIHPITGNSITLLVEYSIDVSLLLNVLKDVKDPLNLTEDDISNNIPNISINRKY